MVIIRVIAGKAGGLQLKTLEGIATRPTSDKVKGSLFNILAPEISGSAVLDLFSGTGALGIEALSRGAKRAVFIDNNPKCAKVIKENLRHTGFAEMSSVMISDGISAIRKLSLSGEKFDMIFIDPPYKSHIIIEVLKQLSKGDIIKPETIITLESDTKNDLPDSLGMLKAYKRRNHGRTSLIFYRMDKNARDSNDSDNKDREGNTNT
ncbi:MAG: 16S rRNA (guanine(966)-N(2))-methyltransferase RsmD [Eubacteriales bacterium]|nr:16S rRNA (guanine(966)-N(2))-methyltransferase RsmD [Eubacteriales bacterium]